MTTPGLVQPLVDAHGTGAGFLSSPRDGTIVDVARNVHALDSNGSITMARRLGVGLEYRLAAVGLGQEFAWGSPWLDRLPRGLRQTLVVTDAHEDAAAAAIVTRLAALGVDIACLGITLTESDVRGALAAAERTGLAVAMELGHGAHAALAGDPGLQALAADIATFEGAAAALATAVRASAATSSPADATPGGHDIQSAFIAIGHLPEHQVVAHAQQIATWGIALTPLMLASWRRADLTAAASAPGSDRLSVVLPFQARIAALRSPGAMAMGKSEAQRHLGLRTLTKPERIDLSRGFEQALTGLAAWSQAGGQLIGGSGAPGLSSCPGLTLREEYELWLSHGIPTPVASFAFTTAAQHVARRANLAPAS